MTISFFNKKEKKKTKSVEAQKYTPLKFLLFPTYSSSVGNYL